MAFWDTLSAIQIRKDSGLTATQIREQNETTMTTFIQGRIVANGVRTRREIDNAAGPYTFGPDGFDEPTLRLLFPAKVASLAHLTEGADILALAREVVRYRVLFDLEERNKGASGDASASGTGQARDYAAQAEAILNDLINSLEAALKGPERGAVTANSANSRLISQAVPTSVGW